MPPPGYPQPTDQLTSGDLVKLTSGGPLMTVLRDTSVGSERKVTCAWFDAHGSYKETALPRRAIAPAPGEAMAERIGAHVFQQAQMAAVYEDRIGRALSFIEKPAGDVNSLRRILTGEEGAAP